MSPAFANFQGNYLVRRSALTLAIEATAVVAAVSRTLFELTLGALPIVLTSLAMPARVTSALASFRNTHSMV